MPCTHGYQTAGVQANAGMVLLGTEDVSQAGGVVTRDMSDSGGTKRGTSEPALGSCPELTQRQLSGSGLCQSKGEDPAGTCLEDAGDTQPRPLGSMRAGGRRGIIWGLAVGLGSGCPCGVKG